MVVGGGRVGVPREAVVQRISQPDKPLWLAYTETPAGILKSENLPKQSLMLGQVLCLTFPWSSLAQPAPLSLT